MASVLALWSTVHGCAHLLIANRLEPCAGGLGRERFLTTMLPPMLKSVIAGCIPAKAKKP